MWRARVETAMAGVAAILGVVAWFWPTWIETLTRLKPDAEKGEAEWWLTLIFAVSALSLALLARRDQRTAVSRSRVAEVGCQAS